MATLSVQPNPLVNGGTATISIEGAEPNQTITIDIDDGGEPPQTASVQITTDDNGAGSTTWTVEDWSAAKFNAPGCTEVARTILDPPFGFGT